MSLLSILVGLGAALALLLAGWLFGVRRGHADREALRHVVFDQAEELKSLNEALRSAREESGRLASRSDQTLRATLEEVIAPLVQRDQLSNDLSRLETGEGRRRDLGLLLDRIADVGNFSTVVICDEEGLPLAANEKAGDVDRRAADVSLVMLLADRMGSGERAQPMSVMIHDEANSTTLCRLFRVQDRRLALSAVTSGARLTPTALDPALVKVTSLLNPGA